jgi:hypothetical protein
MPRPWFVVEQCDRIGQSELTRAFGLIHRHSGTMASESNTSPDRLGADWLLLVYRIPPEPTRLRAGVWRKIKGLGAIYVQNSVAALPVSPSAERAFRTLRAEIGQLGGSAYLFTSSILAGQPQLVEAFNAARDDEYEEIVDRCEDFLQQVRKEYDADHFTYAELEENDEDLTKLKRWLDKVHARDVLGAKGFDRTVVALNKCEQSLEDYAGRVYAVEANGSDAP